MKTITEKNGAKLLILDDYAGIENLDQYWKVYLKQNSWDSPDWIANKIFPISLLSESDRAFFSERYSRGFTKVTLPDFTKNPLLVANGDPHFSTLDGYIELADTFANNIKIALDQINF